MRHAVENLPAPIGVGAFSIAQQRAIEDEVERVRGASADPGSRTSPLARARTFFVKTSRPSRATSAT